MQRAGVDFIIIQCHTAHYWLSELRSVVKTPIYSLVDITVLYIKEKYKDLEDRILPMATETTIKTELYQESLKGLSCRFCIPENDEQRIISSAIAEVKAGRIDLSPQVLCPCSCSFIYKNY